MEIRNRDRLSELPEFLLHQILSYLPTKEAARTTILSKTWLHSYSTSPFLTFSEMYFSRSSDIEQNRYPFFNFVNNTLLRYTSLNLRIHKFQIYVSYRANHPSVYRLLDKSVGLAFDNAVQVLGVLILAYDKFSDYTLPLTMFESPKVLTCLTVFKCNFPVAKSKCNATIFPLLKTLNLCIACIDDGMLQKLLSGSPLLEKICFSRVSGFKQFRVTNLGRLKTLYIHSGDDAIEIDIEDAPSLRLLKYRGSLERPCLLKVGSAENLKNLELDTVSIGDSFLNELITKLPCLEELKIKTCDELERISIFSDSLKHLHFMRCKNLVEAEINLPGLLELDYDGENMLSLSLYNTPQELMTSIYIAHNGHDLPTDEWFHRLRELLKSITQFRVSFRICLEGIQYRVTLDDRANPVPLEHRSENFMPEINPSSLFDAFAETLFSSFRPATIDTCSLAPGYVDFIKFLSSELITATRNPNCCSSARTKCWRHYLKDIIVEVCEEDQDVWQPLHLETSLSEFKFLNKKIRYNLIWYANLNA